MEVLEEEDSASKRTLQNKFESRLTRGDKPSSMEPSEVTSVQQDNAEWLQPPKRIRFGTKVRSQGWKSPSTTSTTSLAQLTEKIAAFPRLFGDRGFAPVCQQPNLSTVTELSEYNYERKRQGTAVFKKSTRKARTSPSDEETGRERKFLSSPNRRLNRSPDSSPNCLIAAAIGPLDRTLVDPEIIDRILKEALQKDVLLDSGINTDKNSSQVAETETIPTKNTKNVTVISKSSSEEQSLHVKDDARIVDKDSSKYKSTTTDESNTEAINDTPHCFVNVRRKPKTVQRNFKVIGDLQPVAVDDMLEFFEHMNREDDLALSPTLARKINASSDSSESFDKIINESQKINEQPDDYTILLNDDVEAPFADVNSNDGVTNTSLQVINADKVYFEVDDNDVLACLASVIDQVCEAVDQPTDIIEQEVEIPIINAEEKEASNKEEAANKEIAKPKKSKMPKIKLAFKNTTAKNTKKLVKKNKLELEPADAKKPDTTKPKKTAAKKKSEVVKLNTDIQEIKVITDLTSDIVENTEPKGKKNDTTLGDPNTPFNVRRKRKLYSPNDDNEIQLLETIEIADKPESKLKTTATSYKDIEKDRKIFRTSRNRKSNSEAISPRTIKNDNLFESLKDNIHNQKDVVFVDVVKKAQDKKMAIYNYSSESSDEDFKATKPPVRKSASLTTRRTRKVKPKINKATSEEPHIEKEPKKKRKTRAKKTPVAKKLAKDAFESLEDERMRDPMPEVLDQSFIAEEQQDVVETLKKVAKRSMEVMPEVILKVKKEKGLKKQKKQEKDNNIKPISPEEELPPLIIEEKAKEGKSSPSSYFAKKIQKLVRDGCFDETNTTHDLLDVDIASSPEIQAEIHVIGDECDDTKNRTKKSRKVIEDIKSIDDENENTASRNTTKKLSQKTKEVQVSDNEYEYEAPNTKTTKKLHKAIKEIHKKSKQNENDDAGYKTKKSSKKTKEIEVSDEDYEYEATNTKTAKNFIEEIHIENKNNESSRTVNKTKKPVQHTKAEKSQPIETVDITSCDQSERSISTYHGQSPITAHGDLDEAPPSPELLDQKFSPRNLSLRDSYAKEYKHTLRSVIRYDSSNSKSSKSSKDTPDLAHSPLVSKGRLPPRDITKWLPSPKSSTTGDAEVEMINYYVDKNKAKGIPNSKSSKDNALALSPVVSIARLSSKEFNKWLPSPKSSTTVVSVKNLSQEELSKWVLSPKRSTPVVSIARLSPEELSTWLPSPKSSTCDTEVEMINYVDKNKAKGIEKEKMNKTETEVDKSTEKSLSESLASPKFKGTLRKSIISPVDFDEYLPIFIGSEEMAKLSEKSKSNSTLKSQKHFQIQATSTTGSESSKVTQILKRTLDLDEIPSKMRKVDGPSYENSLKMDDISRNIENIASHTSLSTERVKQWLVRTDSSKDNEDERGLCNNCEHIKQMYNNKLEQVLQHVMESHDTTLLELHHDTNDRLMNFFVKFETMQRELLAKSKEDFKNLSAEMRATAADILKEDFDRKRAWRKQLLSDLNLIKRQ